MCLGSTSENDRPPVEGQHPIVSYRYEPIQAPCTMAPVSDLVASLSLSLSLPFPLFLSLSLSISVHLTVQVYTDE